VRGVRENDGGDKPKCGTLEYGNITMKPPVQLISANKNIKKKIYLKIVKVVNFIMCFTKIKVNILIKI
jgi:hypothetical protein